MEDHINVAIRVRPLNQRELCSTTSIALTLGQTPWHIQRDTITQKLHADGRACTVNSFTFDRVFDQRVTTQTVYDDIVKEITTSSMSGFNGTIFAYGQTSSGKTHTMYGSGKEPGIIKLAIKNMFDIVANDVTRVYRIRVSFLEIYNEDIRDLLDPSSVHLSVRQTTNNEIYVDKLSEHVVTNADQVEAILAKGDRNRQVAGTNMNERSSRSHTVFSIIIESCERADPAADVAADHHNTLPKRHQRLSTDSAFESGELTGAVTVSSFNLVDLAGSERVGQTGAEGQRLKEGANINRSLLALSNVIKRLAEDGGDSGHVPYRDSKLTRILQPSLGGNARTLIICTITPSPDYIDEALMTLKFASRAKTIQNKPEVNQELRGDALLRRVELAKKQEAEIERLKEELRLKGRTEENNELLQRRLYKATKDRDQLQKELDVLQRNTSLLRATEVVAAAGAAKEIRRQTWVPGQQRTRSEGLPALNGRYNTQRASAAGVLATDAMDIDEGFFSESVTVRSRSRAGLSSDRDSGHSSESLQQQLDEANAKIAEMGQTLQGITQDHRLFLSELSRLAVADVIPPSPAKAGPSSTPQELAAMRRKLRAMIQDREAMQQQCQKFRSQRPEAEFLEMELQSTQKTLSEKEEEIGELKASLAKAEALYTSTMDACSSLQDQLTETEAGRVGAQKLHTELRAKIDHERSAFASDIRKRKEAAEKTARGLESEKAALQFQIDEHISRFESYQKDSMAREKELRRELGATRQALDQHEQRIKSLDADSHQERMSLVRINPEVLDMQNKDSSLPLELEAAQGRASELELQLRDRNSAHADLSANFDEAQAKVQRLEAKLADSLDHGSRLSALAASTEVEKAVAELAASNLREEIRSLNEDAAKAAADRQSLQRKVDEFTLSISKLEAQASVSACETQRERDARAAEISRLWHELQVARQAGADAASTNHRLSEAEDALAKARAAHSELAREHGLLKSQRDAAVQASKAEHEKLTVRIAELGSQLVTMRDQEAKAGERANQLEAVLDSANAQLSLTQARLAEQEQSTSAAALQDAEHRQHIAAFAAVSSEQQTQLAVLRDSLAVEERRLAESEREREHLLKKLGDEQTVSGARILQLEKAVADGRRSLDAAALEHRDAVAVLDIKVHAGSAWIAKLQKDIAVHENAQAELRGQLEQLTAAKAALSGESLALSARIDELLGGIKEAEERASALQTRAETVERATSETRLAFQAQMDELCAQRDRASDEMAKLQLVCNGQAADLQHHKDLVECFEAQAGQSESASKAAIADLRTQLADAISTRAVVEDALGRLQEENKQLSADCDKLSSKATLLSIDLDAASLSSSAAQKHCSEQQRLAESYASQVKDLAYVAEDRAVELATAKAACAAFENKVSELQQSLDAKACECARLATLMTDVIEEREEIAERLATAKKALQEATAAEKQQLSRIGNLEEELRAEQSHSQESVSSIQMRYESEKKVALNRIESLNADVASLRHQLFVQHSKRDALEKELASQRVAVDEALSAIGTLTCASDKLRADYEELVSRSDSAQAGMEQTIAEIKGELDSKCIEVCNLEAALEKANVAQTDTRNADQAKIGKLESLVAAGKSRHAELQAAIAEIKGELGSKCTEVHNLQTALKNAKIARTDVHNTAQTTIEGLESLLATGDRRNAELQATIDEIQVKLSSKCTEVCDLEAALEKANIAQTDIRNAVQTQIKDLQSLVAAGESRCTELQAAIDKITSDLSSKCTEVRNLEAAHTDARKAAQTTIEGLESLVAAGENRAAELRAAVETMRAESEKRVALEGTIAKEHASLAEVTAEIKNVAAERDQARQSIVTLKSMLTELAQIKNGEIAEIEEKLAQHEALLEAAASESLEKDELAKELEKQAAEHLSRAVSAEAEMAKALVQTSLAVEELTFERDSLEAKLAEAALAHAQLEAQVAKSSANSDRLQVEAKRHEQAVADLQLSLDRALSSLADANATTAEAKQARLDLLASVSAELMATIKSLSDLPSCAQVTTSVGDDASYQVLLSAIQEMVAVAVSRDAQTATGNGDSTHVEQDTLRLQALNEKLERKNAKLRDMYKSDMTELHAEEEKQRLRAESLAKDLADSARQIEDTTSELDRVREDLEKQSKRRAELEAAMAQRDAYGSPAKASMARLASQRTPMKQENKRAHLAADNASLAVATLSPISSSTLNSRLAALEEQQRQPARKRTAPAASALPSPDTEALACASDIQTAARADPLRARSNYGDRRRLRRNQHTSRPDGLEEQAAEQCVQQ